MNRSATVLFFYAWTLMLAGFAVALRFIHYSNGHGRLHVGGTVLVAALALIVAAASVYLIYVLEIFRGVYLQRLPKPRPDARGPTTGEVLTPAEQRRRSPSRPTRPERARSFMGRRRCCPARIGCRCAARVRHKLASFLPAPTMSTGT